MDHQLLTAKECWPTHHNDGGATCPICDGGLAFCKVCKKAESELDDYPECPGEPKTVTKEEGQKS